MYIVHCQERGCIGLVVHPRPPRDFSRSGGNLDSWGKPWGRRNTCTMYKYTFVHCTIQYIRLNDVYGHSLINNPSLRWIRKSTLLCSSDSVEINTSLVQMREMPFHFLQSSQRVGSSWSEYLRRWLWSQKILLLTNDQGQHCLVNVLHNLMNNLAL